MRKAEQNHEIRVEHDNIGLAELAKEYSSESKGRIVLAVHNNRMTELTKIAKAGDRVKWIDTTVGEGYRAIQRGLSFVLIRSLHRLLDAQEEIEVLIHYSVNQGFYCELEKNNREFLIPDQELLDRVAEQMKEEIAKDRPIIKHMMNLKQARSLFEKQRLHSKSSLLRYQRTAETAVYELDGYYDYFYGYMVPSTGYLPEFTLHSYESGFMLQFPTKAKPETPAPFHPDRKLFSTLKKTAEWGKLIHVENVADLNRMVASGRMKDLILVTEALMEKNIAEIGTEIAKNHKTKKFVFVAGPSSSGKTTFSHRLAIQLLANGIRAKIISVDNYFVNREDTPKDEFGNYDFETIEAIDVKTFNEHMSTLLAGKKVRLPRFDFVTGRREYDEEETELHENEILIIEGIHCLNDKLSYALPKENKYKIYISALTQLNLDGHNRIPTTDARCLRRMVRDFQYRGVTAEKTLLMWDSVRRGEEKFIFPYQESADFMINSAHIYELAILKQYADPLLFHIDENSPAFHEAKRLLRFLDYFLGYPVDGVPANSILREFIGGSIFRS